MLQVVPASVAQFLMESQQHDSPKSKAKKELTEEQKDALEYIQEHWFKVFPMKEGN